MLARRLLMGGGGSGSFTPPPPSVRALTASPQGGWTTMSQPTAASYGGHTFLGYVNGSNGNIEIVDYDESARTTSSPFVLHSALNSPGDSHDGPAVLVRSSDHRIVVAYSAHDGSHPLVRISTNPADASAFGSEVALSVSAADVTYCNLIQLSSGTIFLFYRDYSAPTHRLAYTTSTDGGATWAAQTLLYANSGEAAYWHVGSNGVDRIDIAVTDKAPQAISGSNASNVYHAYYLGGSWYKTDGTLISVSMPFAPADLTKVADGPTMGGGNFPLGISRDGSGHPVIADVLYLASGTDTTYYDMRWSGSAWVNTAIVNSGGVFFSNQGPGVNVDPADASVYFCGVKVASQFEMFRYVTPDDGATWSGTQLTSSSAAPNIRPAQVANHSGLMQMVWLLGTYTSDTSFSLGVSGWG